jgi:GntR family transcriptional regulator
MIQFHIQPDSEIPASTQLFDQISFAIASRQISPGYRLPSTRQLAMQTGLHRNTISKIYDRLEAAGLVEAQVGSGIYVRTMGQEVGAKHKSAGLSMGAPSQPSSAYKLVQESLDELLNQGYSLHQARDLFLTEINQRLNAGTRVIVTVPQDDLGAGEMMVRELQQSLSMPVQLVPLEELGAMLEQGGSGTVVTSRYFASQAEAIATPQSVRVIPIDIYDYHRELEIIKTLPKESSLGIVCLSPGFLRGAEVVIHSLRGEDLFVMTAQPQDAYKLQALVRNARTIISDQASFAKVKATVAAARKDIIRPPQVICCETFVGTQSIELLKRELGLD